MKWKISLQLKKLIGTIPSIHIKEEKRLIKDIIRKRYLK